MGNACCQARTGRVVEDPLLDRTFRTAVGAEEYLTGESDKMIHLMSYNFLS